MALSTARNFTEIVSGMDGGERVALAPPPEMAKFKERHEGAGNTMNLAIRDIRYHQGRFILTSIGWGFCSEW